MQEIKNIADVIYGTGKDSFLVIIYKLPFTPYYYQLKNGNLLISDQEKKYYTPISYQDVINYYKLSPFESYIKSDKVNVINITFANEEQSYSLNSLSKL